MADLQVIQQPTRQSIAVKDRSAPGKVTGRLRRAIDHMVWDGLTRADAATKANLTEHGLYVAFRKPHVKAYYLGQLEVLRTSEKARNIHTLAEVRDQKSNQMARVAAVKALEQLEDQPQAAAGAQSRPGLIVQIINPPAPTVTNDPYVADKAKPLIEHGVVSDADHTSE